STSPRPPRGSAAPSRRRSTRGRRSPPTWAAPRPRWSTRRRWSGRCGRVPQTQPARPPSRTTASRSGRSATEVAGIRRRGGTDVFPRMRRPRGGQGTHLPLPSPRDRRRQTLPCPPRPIPYLPTELNVSSFQKTDIMARFQGVDYFDIDSLLSEEERMVRDTVREWVDDNLLPIIEEAYINRRFPKELIPQMAELGILGANLPEEYGCAGLNNVAYGLIMQELERGDSGIRSFASVQGALCMYPIFAFGTEEQKRKYLPAMAKGEIIGCFGLTEPDYGSNPGGMITTARKTDSGWVLNGAKMWITNGSMADIAIVWAKTGDLDDPKSIRGFIVPTDTPGFSARDQKGKLSLLASDTSELVLQDVEVGDDALLPGTSGLKSALMCLTQARYGIAWGAVGAAMACFDEALRYAKNRVMFDGPIGGKQIQQ